MQDGTNEVTSTDSEGNTTTSSEPNMITVNVEMHYTRGQVCVSVSNSISISISISIGISVRLVYMISVNVEMHYARGQVCVCVSNSTIVPTNTDLPHSYQFSTFRANRQGLHS